MVQILYITIIAVFHFILLDKEKILSTSINVTVIYTGESEVTGL